MLLREADSTSNKYDLSSIRRCVSAGESLPANIYLRWKEKFGIDIIDAVGSTDVGGLYMSSQPGKIKPGSAGKLLPGFEGKLKNEEYEDVVLGETGALWLKNDGIASMYWNKHEKTKAVFQGQWFNTGDLFYQDTDGYYWYQSRGDDMLKISGQWVSPLEIENIIMKHSSVCECGVIGNPDESGLLKIKAFVVLNKGVQASSELEKELLTLVYDQLAHFKVPRKIEFIHELPRTATGKLQRHKLRQM
jgi:benzoate-CoA ligase